MANNENRGPSKVGDAAIVTGATVGTGAVLTVGTAANVDIGGRVAQAIDPAWQKEFHKAFTLDDAGKTYKNSGKSNLEHFLDTHKDIHNHVNHLAGAAAGTTAAELAASLLLLLPAGMALKGRHAAREDARRAEAAANPNKDAGR